MPEELRRARMGLFLGLGAYLWWGLLPLYFKALSAVSAGEILSHRILWSLIFFALLATGWRRWPQIRAGLRDGRVMLILSASAALIAVNWLVYILAVVNGHVLEGSLGYYLNPLVNVLLGVALLGEKLNRAQIAATALAASGVAVLAVGAGSGLWISLTLASSFGLYGFLRKVAPVDALEGLTIETALLVPFALGWIILLEVQGTTGPVTWQPSMLALLAAGGAITAIPLLLFTAAARRLPLSTMGFLQYIAPSLQFLLAVLLFGEHLTTPHIICFAAIWTALVIFSADGWRRAARARSLRAAESLA